MQILKDSNAIAAELKFDKNEIWTLCVAYVGEGSLNILPKERIKKLFAIQIQGPQTPMF